MTRTNFPVSDALRGSEATNAEFRDPAFLLSLLIPALFGTYLLLTSTTTLIAGVWPYDIKRILQFGLLLTLFLVACFNGKIRDQYAHTLATVPAWIGLVLTGFFAWGIGSVLVNAESPAHAINSFADVYLLASLVLGLFAVAACRRIGGIWFDRIAVGLITLTGVAIGFQELIGVLAAHASGLDFSYRISLLHFSWPRFYNQVQTWTMPLLAAIPALFGRRPLFIGLCALALGLQWYIVLMTGARGSMLSLSLAIAWTSLIFPFLRRTQISIQVAGLAVGIMFYTAIVFSFEHDELNIPPAEISTQVQELTNSPVPLSGYALDNPDNDNKFLSQSLGRPLASSSGRLWMWNTSWQQAKTHPWFGIGPMNFVCTKPPWFGHPHNFPLQIAAEWGMPAALVICLIAGFLLARASCQLRTVGENHSTERLLNGLLLTSVIAAAIHACLSGVLVMPASQTAGLLVGGMLLGSVKSGINEKDSRITRLLVIPGLLLSMALAGYGFSELNTMDRRAEKLPAVESLVPRLWQDSRTCTLTTEQFHVKE